MKFGNNVDLNYNQLENVRLENLQGSPTNPDDLVNGHILYNSQLHHAMLYAGAVDGNGGNWYRLLMSTNGLLGVSQGGTGRANYSVGRMLYASDTPDVSGQTTTTTLLETPTTPFGRGLLNATSGTTITGLVADKLRTGNVGNSNLPIYLSNGVPNQITTGEVSNDAAHNGGLVTGAAVYNFVVGRLADYATNTELAASNNAIAENRARIDDIESLLSAPNFSTAYIGELGVEGINLGGVDIWNEGDVAVVGGSLTAKMSSTSNAFVKAENSNGQIGLLASVSRGVWDYSRSTPNWLIATDGTNTWLSCGDVGIGITNPSAKLHVNGTFNATEAATLGGTLSVTGTATFNNSIRINGGTNRIYFGASSDEYIEFVNIAASGQPALYALHTTLPFYSDSWIASGGVGSSSGGGGGGYNAVTWTDIQSGTGPGLSSEDNSYLPTAYALLQTYVIANNTYSLITGTNGLAARVSNLETSRATTTYVDTAVSGLRADLIEDNKIKTSLLPDYIMGQMLYGGTVAGGGVVTLTQNAKDKYKITSLTLTGSNYSSYEGVYFIASADGSSGVPQTLGVLVGDWIVATSAGWKKIDNTDAVTGVKGDAETNYRLGNVNITAANIGLGNVENTKLSTWTGTSAITTLGTITAGTWHGSQIADAYISSATSWNGAVQLANELDAKMDALQVALPNAIAENRSRIDDIESWMFEPNAAEAYVGELGTMGINLGGVDIWNAGEEVNISGALRVDKASSFNSYINLVGTSKKIYFGGTGTNDPFLEFVNIAASGQPALYALHTNLPFFSDSWIASGGIGNGSGGGGGIVSAIYTEYTQTPAQNSVYSASFVNDIFNEVNSHDSSLSSLNTRVTNIEANGATNIVVPDTGEVLTGASKSGNTITFTRSYAKHIDITKTYSSETVNERMSRTGFEVCSASSATGLPTGNATGTLFNAQRLNSISSTTYDSAVQMFVPYNKSELFFRNSVKQGSTLDANDWAEWEQVLTDRCLIHDYTIPSGQSTYTTGANFKTNKLVAALYDNSGNLVMTDIQIVGSSNSYNIQVRFAKNTSEAYRLVVYGK